MVGDAGDRGGPANQNSFPSNVLDQCCQIENLVKGNICFHFKWLPLRECGHLKCWDLSIISVQIFNPLGEMPEPKSHD